MCVHIASCINKGLDMVFGIHYNKHITNPETMCVLICEITWKLLAPQAKSRRQADFTLRWWASWAQATTPWSAWPFPWLSLLRSPRRSNFFDFSYQNTSDCLNRGCFFMLPLPVKPLFVLGKSFLSTFVSKFVRDKMGRTEVYNDRWSKSKGKKVSKTRKNLRVSVWSCPNSWGAKMVQQGRFFVWERGTKGWTGRTEAVLCLWSAGKIIQH